MRTRSKTPHIMLICVIRKVVRQILPLDLGGYIQVKVRLEFPDNDPAVS